MDTIKVKAVSRTAGVAGAIAGVIREEKYAEVQAIGAGADIDAQGANSDQICRRTALIFQ